MTWRGGRGEAWEHTLCVGAGMGSPKATLRSHSLLPAPEHSYLVLLVIVLGEAALQPQREFLELHDDNGVASIVFEAHGVFHYVLYQEKRLLQVAHGIFLKNENLEFMVWLMWSGNPGSVTGAHIPGGRRAAACLKPAPEGGAVPLQ